MKGHISGSIRFFVVFSIVFLPFADILLSRFEKGGETLDDIRQVSSGGIEKRANLDNQTGGTLTYRLAWVYERADYLSNRPLTENIFGLGLISDGQYEVQRKYHFMLGIVNSETGFQSQLRTPDIAYGNMLTQFGYLGGLLLLGIWFRLVKLFYKARNKNAWVFCMFLFLTLNIVASISGDFISITGNLVIPYLLLPMLRESSHLKANIF